tara:strand:- start:1865 stop:2821 length:957 start_codon:yes stop_codon:yes gene_type:complete
MNIKLKKISLIFSFYNEEPVFDELISRVEKVFCDLEYNYELIFINDNSTDNSLKKLIKIREGNKKIKIINMSRRFGSPSCVIAGFRNASGDAIIYMDSDLQDPPEIIPKLIKEWNNGFEVVHTTRTKREGEKFIKLWVTEKAYKVINWFSDINIPKNTGDFKLLSRKAVNSILELEEDDPFIRGLSIWIGFKQTKVYYVREPRLTGDTKYPSHGISGTSIKELIKGISSFSLIPLYFSLFVGLVVSFLSFLFLTYILISKIFFSHHLPGWSALMITILFLGGIILFTIGILGVYVGKIHQDIKRRPKFIISEKIGFRD